MMFDVFICFLFLRVASSCCFSVLSGWDPWSPLDLKGKPYTRLSVAVKRVVCCWFSGGLLGGFCWFSGGLLKVIRVVFPFFS